MEFDADVGARADIPAAAKGKAALEISFKAENAVLFNAAGVRYDSVSDHGALGRRILELYEDGRWDPRHSVITELARAGSTTVIISSGTSASILLLAEADVPSIDLADASAKFSPSLERDIGYKAIAEDGMIPLFGLARVRPNKMFWWRQPEFRKRMGFQASGEGDGPPEGFAAALDASEEALRDHARARGTGFGEAFALEGQQPDARPGGGP